jgi:hypothetical protein
MEELGIGAAVFLCLAGAALFCLFLHERLPASQREERTHGVVKLAIGMVVVMTSLVLGLLIGSVQNSFNGIDHNVHAFSTQLILLDRELKLYGPQTQATRALLATYVQRALDGTWPASGKAVVVEDSQAGQILDEVEQSLKQIKPGDPQQAETWNGAFAHLQKVVELRWSLIQQSGDTIATPVLVILVGWLMVIFASFGYNAPRNGVVVGTLLLCSLSIALAIYLIVELDGPFTGMIQVSPLPVQRALAVMQQG